MELEDIKIGDVLFLKDKIEGQMVRERVPMDKSDIKDNPNYGIYYEERKGRGYIFQLKKDVYQNPDIIHPFNYIKVDIDKDGDRLKISAGYPPRSRWPSTGVREVGKDGQGEHLTMGGGGGWIARVGGSDLIPRWLAPPGTLYKIDHNRFQSNFINWTGENPLEVKG